MIRCDDPGREQLKEAEEKEDVHAAVTAFKVFWQ